MNEFTLSGPAWFAHSPEPVILIQDECAAYYNAAAEALSAREGWQLDVGRPLPEPLQAVEVPGVQMLTLGGEQWLCRGEKLEAGALLCLTHQSAELAVPLARLSQLAGQMRMPLGNLIGVSQLLTRTEAERTPEKTRQYQAIQRKNYYALLRMLDTLETLGTIAQEQSAFQGEVLDLGGLCGEIVRRVQSAAAEYGCTVTLEQKSGNLLVQGEQELLRTLVYQLLSNAMRAAGEQGQVALELDKREAPGKGKRWVRLIVRDSGAGYPPEQLPRVFDPAQGGYGLLDRPAGLGVGLALCRGIVERHGGRLILQNGAGAVTAVELPLYEGNAFSTLRSPTDLSGGMNDTLLQLADVLPWQCFTEDE